MSRVLVTGAAGLLGRFVVDELLRHGHAVRGFDRNQQLVLQDVNPPDPVKPAFNEVNQAIQEKERAINEAWAEYNKAVPKAKGEAEQAIRAAEGYAIERVNNAEGDGHPVEDHGARELHHIKGEPQH